MSLRVTDLEQLGEFAPALRAQLERELGPGAGGVSLPRRRNGQPEQEAGAQLVEWVDLLPVLANGIRPGELFYHVANAGVAGGKVRGGILQGQGVRAGWPDYGLDLPRGGYHGLRLELKAVDEKGNGPKPTEQQLVTLRHLERVGYKAVVAWGFEEARHAIEQYLALDQ